MSSPTRRQPTFSARCNAYPPEPIRTVASVVGRDGCTCQRNHSPCDSGRSGRKEGKEEMKAAKNIFILLVLISSPAFSQQGAECRPDLKTWVPMFKAAYDAASNTWTQDCDSGCEMLGPLEGRTKFGPLTRI